MCHKMQQFKHKIILQNSCSSRKHKSPLNPRGKENDTLRNFAKKYTNADFSSSLLCQNTQATLYCSTVQPPSLKAMTSTVVVRLPAVLLQSSRGPLAAGPTTVFYCWRMCHDHWTATTTRATSTGVDLATTTGRQGLIQYTWIVSGLFCFVF